MKEEIVNETTTVTVIMDFMTSPEELWQWLTKPELVRKYFFGTSLESNWEIGKPITFSGVWDGVEYTDKGVILDIRENEFLKYSYFSSFSELEDLPENYSNISYKLSKTDNGTRLEIRQSGGEMNEDKKAHSEANWAMVLNSLKIEMEGNLNKK